MMEKVAREHAEWLEKPRQIDAEISDKVSIETLPYLSQRVRSNLLESGITEFYPVQHGLIPFIIDSAGQSDTADVCCSAPTGSGKTLAYAIPLVEILSRAVCERKVAALVVLPVKELAEQVATVIRRVARETGVTCALLSGEKSFEEECSELNGADWRSVAERDFITFLQQPDAAVVNGNGSEHVAERAVQVQRCSRQTIVVCTPSRLLLHIHRNTTFCEALRSLMYLVIDEADRVLHDAVRSGWLSALEHAVGIERYARSALLPRLASVPFGSISTSSLNPIRKLLLSATFTRNPELLHAMRMHKPVLFAARPIVKVKPKAAEKSEENTAQTETDPVAKENPTEAEAEADNAPCRYVAPSGLQEYFVASSPEYKPLTLYMLLRTKMGKLCADADAHMGGLTAQQANAAVNGKPRRRASVLCFANSRESSHRLAHVLAQLGGSQLVVSELSARLPSAKRRRIIAQLGRSEIDIVVCTDAMARGMDIGNVRCVISYDMPAHAKTYVHRCGRTARAGQHGTAISILHRSQVRAFKTMLQQITGGGFGANLREEKLPEQRLRPFRKAYQESLRSLRTSVRAKREKSSKEHDATTTTTATATATAKPKISAENTVDIKQK